MISKNVPEQDLMLSQFVVYCQVYQTALEFRISRRIISETPISEQKRESVIKRLIQQKEL
jgi:hypothetical protein